MKIQVYDSDGDFKGGLFKTKSFNAPNCRMWHAPPHPNYRESLIDIAGKGNPCYESSWFRLQVAAVPDISGPSDGSDDFDANSRAYRISASEAAAWLERHAFPIPADLKALLPRDRNGTAAPTATETSPSRPLPEGTAEVWEALNGQMLTAKEIAQKLRITEDAVRKRVARLREDGRTLDNRRGSGYFRPDAPPPNGVRGGAPT